MSCREEQDFAEWFIDSLKFGAGDECVDGTLDVSRLTRLADVVVDMSGRLQCRLSGFCGEGDLAGRFGLRLQVSGRLALCCQRCLGAVDFDCDIDRQLLLIPDGEVWPEDELEAESYDAIPADREMAVMALVEDEVLLALPLVPRHADCRLPAGVVPAEEKSAVSPFAALAGLKKH